MYKSLNFDFSKQYESKRLDLELVKIEKETSEVLQNIFFDSGSSVLRKESNIELNKLKDLLIRNPNLKIEISGHTDDIGNDQTNMELSKKRAQSVVNFLLENGIATDRMFFKGFGESIPKVKNDTELNRQQNRRIELKFI